MKKLNKKMLKMRTLEERFNYINKIKKNKIQSFRQHNIEF